MSILLLLTLVVMGSLFTGMGIALVLSLYARREEEQIERERHLALRHEHV